MRILAADIGGTNSRFGHFIGERKGTLSLVETIWLKTEDSISLDSLLNKIKKDKRFSLKPHDADIVVIAIAGPVISGVYSSPPFIPWYIDISNAKKDFGFKQCRLINDFVAQAYACKSPVGDEARIILEGEIVNDAPVAVIGAGTALGKAVLISDGSHRLRAVASEGGHTEFPFVGKEECNFQRFLIEEYGSDYITANYVVSGRGLSYIHRFLTGKILRPEEIAVAISNYPRTHEWAARFYGRACRNFALETLSQGGVYIAGGVAAKAPELLTHSAFEKEFRSSKTMAGILEKIPVYLITDENSGLWGAALMGLQSLLSKEDQHQHEQ